MKDNRDPQSLGEALLQVRTMNPEKSLSQCADMMEKIYTSFGTPASYSMPLINNVHANGTPSDAHSNPDH